MDVGMNLERIVSRLVGWDCLKVLLVGLGWSWVCAMACIGFGDWVLGNWGIMNSLGCEDSRFIDYLWAGSD